MSDSSLTGAAMAAGLLVLTGPINHLVHRFQASLPELIKINNNRLYVHLLPGVNSWPPQRAPVQISSYANVIGKIYSHSFNIDPHLDVRVLLNGVKGTLNPIHYKVLHPIRHIFFENKSDVQVINGYLNGFPDTQVDKIVLPKHVEEEALKLSMSAPMDAVEEKNTEYKSYDRVVLGGTFDRLHAGHKVFLMEAILRTRKSLTIGVTDESMLKSKVLSELILPLEQRIAGVSDFVRDQDPYLEYKIVPISDPYGPSIVDPDLELIVGSQESERGCVKVNEKREAKNLKPLDIFVIPLVEDEGHSEIEETKASSSSLRMRLLGTNLKKTQIISTKEDTYIIGLTGGSASGKSSIAKYLAEKYDVGLIDCDKLGHSAYKKGTDCYQAVIEAFGQEVVDPSTGEINRKVLGSKIFTDPSEKKKLESIVWPVILESVAEKATEYAKMGKKVVVVDAAVLIQARWDIICDEVWVTIIPKEEAIKRICQRDNKTEKEAEQRIEAQLSNKEFVSKANVVFCSLWDYAFTRSQVVKAIERVLKQITK